MPSASGGENAGACLSAAGLARTLSYRTETESVDLIIDGKYSAVRVSFSTLISLLTAGVYYSAELMSSRNTFWVLASTVRSDVQI